MQKPTKNYSQAHTSNVCAIEHIVKIVKQNQIKSEAYCDPFTSKLIFLDGHFFVMAWKLEYTLSYQLMTNYHIYEC